MPLLGRIEVGDMVKFERGSYSHWGVCTDDDEMVHLGPEGNDQELNSISLAFQGEKKAIFKKDRISWIARDCNYYAHNYLDDKYKPQPASDIRNFALKHFKRAIEWKYHLIWDNCEKFAILCRYRVDYMGSQAESGLIAGAMGAGLLGLGLAALAGYAASRDTSEEEKRKEDRVKHIKY
ncbi:phospholipase A and acyltransferase 2-like [Convolutriloba macropyga]|uniref:phospholipase A and acyltransferase 2-like n=1 Tax=Convolutriloba macropyga TaxID=536237 RepID=UPI003F51CEBA